MKKRALILAMIAFIAATTSEPSINMVRAEETQVEETQTEECDLWNRRLQQWPLLRVKEESASCVSAALNHMKY